MAKQAFRPNLLNVSTRNYPFQKERVIDISSVDGGLNTWEQSYKLAPNQSPDLENMWWNDGALMSRRGQSYVHFPATTTGVTTVVYGDTTATVTVTNYLFALKIHTNGSYVFTFSTEAEPDSWTYNGSPVLLSDYGIYLSGGTPVNGDTVTVTYTADTYGQIYNCYDYEWSPNYMCAHIGTHMYKVDIRDGSFTSIYSGLGASAGYFFVQDADLYYISATNFIKITEGWVASDVTPFVPTTVVNRYPDGTGGSLYQPENRIAAGKKVWFTAHKAANEATYPTEYVLPYTNLDSTAVTITATVYENDAVVTKTYQEVQLYNSSATGVAGVVYLNNLASPTAAYTWTGTAYASATVPTMADTFTVDRTTGVITFNTAPTNTDVEMTSNVKVTLYATNSVAEASIRTCKAWTVFSVGGIQTVVCGGCTAQKNAYFWSGGNEIDGSDATYFPMDYYNVAGSADTAITAFGKQQDLLVVFKERAVGKVTWELETISDRTYINLPYIPINESIGCDLPKTVQLVVNNLVFANSYAGVFMLLDTSAAGENAVARLSRNVNGSDTAPKLLYDLQYVDKNAVTSYDDDKRYWICANKHVYVWDYRIRFYSAAYPNEEKLSWFYLTNIDPLAWMYTIDTPYYVKADGSIVKFATGYSDFGQGFKRRFTYATEHFFTYEVLKDITKVIFSLTSDTNTDIDVTYNTDYEQRKDLTGLNVTSWRLVPRDLSKRDFRVTRYAGVCVRKPRCFHVRHFSITLEIDKAYMNMSLVGAQIYYRYSEEDR